MSGLPWKLVTRKLAIPSVPLRTFSTKIAYHSLKNGDRDVAHLSFFGSKKYAFVNAESIQKLIEAFKELDSHPRLGAVFLRSTFPGADINVMASLNQRQTANEFISSIKTLCDQVYYFRAPVIAVVDGPCLGAGMELVASCDLRIAVDGAATFAMPETVLGIPSVAQASLIPGLIGWGRTRELLYFGGKLDAKQAYDWGFVNILTDRAKLEDTILQYEEKIDATGKGALEAQKRVMAAWQSHDAGILGNTDKVNAHFGECIDTGEPSRLMKKFLEAKNKPKKDS